MSDRGDKFVKAWVSQNVHNVPGLEDLRGETTRLAAALIADARAYGLSEEELAETVGDIEDRLTMEYENVHAPEAGFR